MSKVLLLVLVMVAFAQPVLSTNGLIEVRERAQHNSFYSLPNVDPGISMRIP